MLGTIESLINVLILSTLAGLATALGGLVVLIRKPGKQLLGALMGLAAGVMLGLSFLKLLSEALDITGLHVAVLGFGAGATLMSILDWALPHLLAVHKRLRPIHLSPEERPYLVPRVPNINGRIKALAS